MKNVVFPRTLVNLTKILILTKHKSFKSSLNIPINEENCELTTLYYIIVGTLYWIPKCQKNQYLNRYIPGSSTCSKKELSITMAKILHAVKGGLQSHCNKVYSRGNINQKHRIMDSVLASSVIDRGFEPRSGQPSTITLVCVASTKSTQHYGERAKTGWLGIRIMCPSGVACLPADCCFSELAL